MRRVRRWGFPHRKCNFASTSSRTGSLEFSTRERRYSSIANSCTRNLLSSEPWLLCFILSPAHRRCVPKPGKLRLRDAALSPSHPRLSIVSQLEFTRPGECTINCSTVFLHRHIFVSCDTLRQDVRTVPRCHQSQELPSVTCARPIDGLRVRPTIDSRRQT